MANQKLLTEADYAQAATFIKCKVAAIRAVAEVESKGSGFLPDGTPTLLFEPHIFWKRLKEKGITPVLSDICYPVWGTKPYGKYSEQPGKLLLASRIDHDAAFESCSWGKFQIMGFNWKACGCESLQVFINKMYESEGKQLDCFGNYILSSHLDDELIHEDWKGLARGYNGPSYTKNNYDGKLQAAFKKYNNTL